MESVKVYFTDFFDIEPQTLEEYGAFNISLINDLPLFIDPFLLFNSPKPEYQQLHDDIIKYLRFLRDKSMLNDIPDSLVRSWYTFREVKQNWLGYSLVGNSGSGLGNNFAQALHLNLNTLFTNFGIEKITKGSHLEKLCLIDSGIGKDNISDFTTNLIKQYLLEYTQRFAQQNIAPNMRRRVRIPKVRFNYKLERWVPEYFEIPHIDGDYIILTPKDILTKEDPWINRSDLLNNYDEIVAALPNDELRGHLNNYLVSTLSEAPTKKERRAAIAEAIRQFPTIIEYFIKLKEEEGDTAVAVSDLYVQETEQFFISQVTDLIRILQTSTHFYELSANSVEDTLTRIHHLKDVIENKEGAHLLYLQGEPIRREQDLHILLRLVWCGIESSTNANAYQDALSSAVITRTSWDSTFLQFKLATNRQLKSNLEKLVDTQNDVSDVGKAIRVIFYFDPNELHRVNSILDDLQLKHHPDIILINGQLNGLTSDSELSTSSLYSGLHIEAFQRALLSSFGTPAELEQMARFKLNLNLWEFTTANGLAAMTYDLIKKMESRGKFEQLVEAAYAANSTNVLLSEFVRREYPQFIQLSNQSDLAS